MAHIGSSRTRSAVPALGPEQRLLLSCARYAFDRDAAGLLQRVPTQPVDWTALITLAGKHRLLPCVQAAFTAAGAGPVPAAIQSQLRTHLHAITARQLLLTQELCRLLDLFEDRRLHVIPFKGPAFAALLDGQVLLRQCSDLDLLLDAREVPRASEVLQSRGYRSRLRLGWEHSFLHKPTRILVDIHWAFTPKTFYFPLTFAEVSTRLATVEVGGRKMLTLSKADAMLVLCANAAKDGWVSLGRLYEIAHFAQLQDPAWPELLDSARRLHCERVLLIGLHLAHALFGAPLPGSILERTMRERAVGKLAAEISDHILWAEQRGPLAMAQLLFGWRTREGLRAKIPYGRRMLGLLMERLRRRSA